MPSACSKLQEVSGSERKPGAMRVVALSGFSAFLAPLVFVGLIALRKAQRRLNVYTRSWNKRLQNEIARWT